MKFDWKKIGQALEGVIAEKYRQSIANKLGRVTGIDSRIWKNLIDAPDNWKPILKILAKEANII